MSVLRQDFGIRELEAALSSSSVEMSVVVQARQSLEETRTLLKLAAEENPIAAVTGWLPLASGRIEETMEEFASDPLLKGVRHFVQDEPDTEFMLRPDFNRGVDILKSRDLVYEILIVENQLPQTLEFVAAHPDQPMILDHCGKPDISRGRLEPWAGRIRALARFEHVSCKLSGLVTEADPANWSLEILRPYMELILEAFGPQRLLFGSDWPVCLVGTEYREWTAAVEEFIMPLSRDEQAAIMGGNAARIYQIAKRCA